MVIVSSNTNVWIDGHLKQGVIEYSDKEPIVKLLTGKIVKDLERVIFERHETIVIQNDGVQKREKLETSLRVHLKPIITITRNYTSSIHIEFEDIYPPSSGLMWYSKMSYGTDRAVYIVHRIENDERFWLVIINEISREIIEEHPIQSYEVWILKTQTYQEAHNDWYNALSPENSEEIRQEILGTLDTPAMTWPEYESIMKGIHSGVFKRGKTVRDVFDFIVPKGYPERDREEIMTFLAWITKKKIYDDEPVKLFNELLVTPTLRSLMITHYLYVLSDVQVPDYLKHIILVSEGVTDEQSRSLDETEERDIHRLLLFKFKELALDLRKDAIKYAIVLNKSNQIVTKLPINAIDARRSETAWSERFAMLREGLLLKGHVRNDAMGLVELLYIGAAHRWPHSHLTWSARLGAIQERFPHLQVMVMPPSSAEQITRILPKVIRIDWSTRRMNLNLFDSDSGVWTCKGGKILSSVKSNMSFKKLTTEFGKWRETGFSIPSKSETRCIDMVRRGLFLTDFEHKRGETFWGYSSEDANKMLTGLDRKGILQLSYEINETGLSSLATVIQGNPKQMNSVVYALGKYLPSSLIKVSNESNFSIVISRISLKDRSIILNDLPRVAKDADLNIRCMIPEAYRNYTWDFYQRLLNSDNSWNTDVSGLLSQVRSAPKALMDEVMQEMS